MRIKDRGKKKWQGAFFMTEHIGMLTDLKKDYYRQSKPIVDDYELDKYNIQICLAMEFTYRVIITTWEDGFQWEYLGLVHRIDEFAKTVYLELDEQDGYITKIAIADIVGVSVMDSY